MPLAACIDCYSKPSWCSSLCIIYYIFLRLQNTGLFRPALAMHLVEEHHCLRATVTVVKCTPLEKPKVSIGIPF